MGILSSLGRITEKTKHQIDERVKENKISNQKKRAYEKETQRMEKEARQDASRYGRIKGAQKSEYKKAYIQASQKTSSGSGLFGTFSSAQKRTENVNRYLFGNLGVTSQPKPKKKIKHKKVSGKYVIVAGKAYPIEKHKKKNKHRRNRYTF